MKILLILFVGLVSISCAKKEKIEKPNVIIIMTDDQGYGDFGFTGNHHVKTPVLDNLAEESFQFDNFYVSPVCAPTRASIMTGRQSLRTGIRDTYNGGAIMHTDEITLAEILKEANYETGIFGKWHLGDNFPSRPMDQGFDESLIHLSGGMSQVGDFTTYFRKDSSYFDPILWHNGQQESYNGYCSDIFAKGAIDFIEKNKENPFFCYLSFNAPHTPLQLPQMYNDMYKDIDPSSGFESSPEVAEMTEKDKEDARKVYGMVSNIDDNIGSLLKKLDDLNIADNTLLIFLTDNGPQQRRYVAGMKGRKAMVYRGGVRVPMLLRYPAKFKEAKRIKTTATHMDILPTIASLTGAQIPNDRKIDGKKLNPLLEGQDVDWSDRSLFFSWTRRYPELYQNVALQKGDYRLVGMTDYDARIEDFELYNISKDPGESLNLVNKEKQKAEELKTEFDTQYHELTLSDHLVNKPLIAIGHSSENPTFLNRNDAGGQKGIWAEDEAFGLWHVKIHEGIYNIKFKFLHPVEQGTAFLEVGTQVIRKSISTNEEDLIELSNVHLIDMEGDLIPYYMENKKRIFPFWVELEKTK
ncbi:MAG: arylsulfatase A-like enzyme [Arcticibacterium sp.]|jgi:arylsulfatase A-like enzyme